MWFLYDLAIAIYGTSIRIAALFNKKARKWVIGRRLASTPSLHQLGERERERAIVWFHCASLGEFEQGRPVIEAFREKHPDWKIILSFFSPSGYEIRKNYEKVDHIVYLPLDTRKNAREFIKMIHPSLVVFVKYEYWFRYLDELYKENIPVYIISAIFRPSQHFFKWYGGWMLKQLRKVTMYFVQNEVSADLLRGKGIGQVIVSGDTRFDRVATIAENAKSFPLLEKFASGKPVFLAGSTWPADEELVFRLMDKYGDRMKFIIAPHEVQRERIRKLVSSWQLAVSSQQSAISNQKSAKIVLFSELKEENVETAQIIIIDGIGYLSHLYQYATIAYIGGGFGAGIHNILEGATFGKPVIFGPMYHKFREAVELIKEGGAFSINNTQLLINRTIELLDNDQIYKKSSTACSSYVKNKKGATEMILNKIIRQ
jgi:3-deoxy-D-manno-octulosonic-acid transferase